MKKLRVGDSVTIKSIDWYNKHKDKNGIVRNSIYEYRFQEEMVKFCGNTYTIQDIDMFNDLPVYHLEGIAKLGFSEYMFEDIDQTTKTFTYLVGYVAANNSISSEIIHLNHLINEQDIYDLQSQHNNCKVFGFSRLN